MALRHFAQGSDAECARWRIGVPGVVEDLLSFGLAFWRPGNSTRLTRRHCAQRQLPVQDQKERRTAGN